MQKSRVSSQGTVALYQVHLENDLQVLYITANNFVSFLNCAS